MTRDLETGPPPNVGPPPCPRCGNPERKFTPNARRDPYAEPPAYEAAWQCTRCGLLDFLDDRGGGAPAIRR